MPPYVSVSRLVSYKRMDLIIEAFRAMPGRKLVVIGDGPQMRVLQAHCPQNVTLMGWQPDAVVREHLANARAFVFAAHEDFGISPVEAQACGTPVIAYGAGGSVETVRDVRMKPEPTGLLFEDQTPASLVHAVEAFEKLAVRIEPDACRRWAETFSEARFAGQFKALIETAWDEWQSDPQSLEARIIGPLLNRQPTQETQP